MEAVLGKASSCPDATYMANTFPSLFLSHGSPMLAVQDSATGRFLDRLGESMPRPRAIVVASAHFAAARPTLTAAESPTTVHDFGGFPPALYRITYPAPGSPPLARQIAQLLEEAGFAAAVDTERGLDHGAWVPLHRIYPQADIPVVSLSVDPRATAAWHYQLGQALAGLRRQGVLVIGSGGFSHNLHALDWQRADAGEFDWVHVFTSALRSRIEAGDIAGALDWQSLPEARRNHPTPEHLYPLYVAWGAAGTDTTTGRLLHRDVELGGLALDAYAFGEA